MADSIVLLPLDSRPVNVRLPASLARLAGAHLITPPMRMLGNLHHPADFEAIRSWIFDTLTPESTVLFVSVDLLCYGGLIFSRENRVSQEIALKRLSLLRHVKKQFPNVRMFSTGVILRDSISVRNDDDFALWEQLQSGRGPYPDWFLGLRRRNAAVNAALLDLAADGVVDFALLGKEDTAPSNPFKKEITSLRRMIRARSLAGRACVINGTDELAALLIARWQSEKFKNKPRFLIDSMGSDFLDKTPLFESQALARTLREQIRVAGGRVAAPGKPYDIRLFLHCPLKQQQDLFAMQLQGLRRKPKPVRNKQYYRTFVDAVNGENKLSAVADLAYANGSDPALTDALISRNVFLKLASWAAWNTASNTTGTVIASSLITQLLLSDKLNDTNPDMINNHIHMLLSRLADDDIYQSRVRNDLVKHVDNPHSIGNMVLLNETLNRIMNECWNNIIHKNILSRTISTCFSEMDTIVFASARLKSVKLPWRRLFECDAIPDAHFSVLKLGFPRTGQHSGK